MYAMNKLIKIIAFCFSIILFGGGTIVTTVTPGPSESITAAIKAGNSKELAKFFGQTVEVLLPGIEGAFSKAQAEMIMKDFFTKSLPVSFVVNQKGNSAGGTQFMIGTYKSKSEVLNVYILLKPVSGQMMIQQIHFEND
jgi:hypothetical protein